MINTQKKVLCYLFKARYSCFKGLLFVCIGLAIFSCSSVKIEIQVAVLPEYPIAEDIQSLLLLNRSMTNQFTNNKIDTLEKILISKTLQLDSVFQDSIATDTVIQVAAKALFESGRFDVVIPKEPNIVRTDNEAITNPLNTSFINELCSDFKVDGVLVLESFAESLTTKYYENRSDVNFLEISGYIATTDLSYLSDWRLYRPNDFKSVIRFQIGDSIFWDGNNYVLKTLYSQMPRTKEALIGGGIAAGLKIAGYISPSWVNQSRYYYLTDKAEIDAAVPLIKNNKWEEATAIWTKYTAIPSKTIRSKVEFNLSLAAEMNGDLDLAIEWGQKSYKTRYNKATEVYLKILDDKRKAQQKENKKRY